MAYFPITTQGFYQNFQGPATPTFTASTNNATSNTNQVFQFTIPHNISFSYFRMGMIGLQNIPILPATTNATWATTLIITASANVVIYSLGTGSASSAFRSVLSGNTSWVISVNASASAAGSTATQTLNVTHPTRGGSSSSSSFTGIINYNAGGIFLLNGLFDYRLRFEIPTWLDVPITGFLASTNNYAVAYNTLYSTAGGTAATSAKLDYTPFALTQAVNSIFAFPNNLTSTFSSASPVALAGLGIITNTTVGTTSSFNATQVTINAPTLSAFLFQLRSGT